MANTYVDYTAVASQTDYNFSFEYLRDDHVKVKVNDVIVTNYTIVTSPVQLIRFNTAPVAGADIKIYRDSRGDFSPLVDFVNGSVLTESELDESYKHNLFVSQESSEGTGGEQLTKKGLTDYDAEGNKIINLGTPTAATDAANKAYTDQTVDNAIALGGSPAIVSLGGYDVTSTLSTTARTLADRFSDIVNVLDYIPANLHASIKNASNTTDLTSYIQTAIDAQKIRGGSPVYMPSGTYLFTQLKIPRNFSLIGDGARATLGTNSIMGGTVLKQKDGAEKDGIVFTITGGDDNVSSILLKGFLLLGPDTISTAETSGIKVDDPDSANQPDFAGTVIFEDIFIRYWKGSGINTSGATLWNFRCENITARENGRYGFETGNSIIASTSIKHITLEYNRLGGIYIGTLGSERGLRIENIYLEGGNTSGRFGVDPTFSVTSPYGVILKGKLYGSRKAGVSIKNGVFYGVDPNNPEAFIYMDSSGGNEAYSVEWENLFIRSDYASGNAYVFKDEVTTQTVNNTYITGSWIPDAGDTKSILKSNTEIKLNNEGSDNGFINLSYQNTTKGYIGAKGLYDESNNQAFTAQGDTYNIADICRVKRPPTHTPRRLEPTINNAVRFGGAGSSWSAGYMSSLHLGQSGTATGVVFFTTGTGSPEGVVIASVGSLFTRTDGGAGTTLYVKESGTGNTGWVAK
jgi:hypothetical protein